MLHFLYIVAFTVVALLAVGNLIRNMITLGAESQRGPYASSSYGGGTASAGRKRPVPHPELLDNSGNPVNEPLLVMRSMTVEDAREQLDAIYRASPGGNSTEEA